MAWSSACRSSYQNLYNGKDEFAGETSTEGSDRCTPVLAATCAPTPAVTPVVTPLIASGSADFSVVRYSEDDLQRILRTVLDSRPLAPVLTSIVAAAPHYEGPRERPLKVQFPDIYWGKTHLECYNFFQQCEDHFATANATGPSWVLFTTTFLKNTALFCWQQH